MAYWWFLLDPAYLDMTTVNFSLFYHVPVIFYDLKNWKKIYKFLEIILLVGKIPKIEEKLLYAIIFLVNNLN